MTDRRTHTATAKLGRVDFFERYFWIVQVSFDRENLTRGATDLVILLTEKYINGGHGAAWPSEETLARQIKCTPRTIRRLIADLVVRGHLSVGENRGKRQTNEFRMILQ